MASETRLSKSPPEATLASCSMFIYLYVQSLAQIITQIRSDRQEAFPYQTHLVMDQSSPRRPRAKGKNKRDVDRLWVKDVF